jgi:uncharacterized membrane protein YcaP (DUF421 family)
METVIRVVIIYIFIVVALRVVGKREFSQLSPLELVTLLIIPELVSQALTHEDFSLLAALIGSATLIVLVYISSLLQFYNKPIERAINSQPSVLVQKGKYIEKTINQERVPPEEVFSAMREAGIDELNKVRWAILEPDGKISIVAEEEAAQQQNSAILAKEAAL